jgi:hypothetical protein
MFNLKGEVMRPWNRADIELLTRECNSGATVESIATKLNRTSDEVRLKAKELGLKFYKSRQQDNDLEL